MRVFPTLLFPVLFLLTSLVGALAIAQNRISLDQALELARMANASLPVARFNTHIATETVAESQGKLGPTLSTTGTLPYAPPAVSYYPGSTVNEASLLLKLSQPIYAGNTLRGQLEANQHKLASAEAGYQIAEKDLELEVRSRFSEMLQYDSNIVTFENGIERLRTYLSIVKARKASGQGVEADLLKTQVRMDDQEALLTEARRNRQEAGVELNVLLGRSPGLPLELLPLPEPTALPEVPPVAFENIPDIAQTLENHKAALAEISVARGNYLPHFNLFANTGLIDPGVGVTEQQYSSFGQRLRSDLGVAIGVEFKWDIWNFGAFRAQVAQARFTAEKAAASIIVTKRQTGLEYERALVDLKSWFSEYKTRAHQVPLAQSAYVSAESLYRGGSGTALSVLDSFSSLVTVELSYAQALYQLRVAHARLTRRSGQ